MFWVLHYRCSWKMFTVLFYVCYTNWVVLTKQPVEYIDAKWAYTYRYSLLCSQHFQGYVEIAFPKLEAIKHKHKYQSWKIIVCLKNKLLGFQMFPTCCWKYFLHSVFSVYKMVPIYGKELEEFRQLLSSW